MSTHAQPVTNLLTADSIMGAIGQSVTRLTFRYQVRNPVMFIVFIAAILTTIIFVGNLMVPSSEPSWFIGSVAAWLWFTSIFANFAESIAESKGKAQAESLKNPAVMLWLKSLTARRILLRIRNILRHCLIP